MEVNMQLTLVISSILFLAIVAIDAAQHRRSRIHK